LIIKYL